MSEEHIICTLDHTYTNIPGNYEALPCSSFYLCYHISLPLLPMYFQLIEMVKLSVKTV